LTRSPRFEQNRGMKTLRTTFAAVFAAVLIAAPSMAQTSEAAASPAAPAAGQPSAEDMKKMMQQMMELAKLNENHKILGELAGNWSYTVKMWMDPSAPPQESKGTAVRKPIMDGRYYLADVTGQMEMPGPDGKKTEMTFKGKSIEGYDNAKKKFVSSWIDNMGTGIMMSEGTYDPATKTFSYDSEVEMMPGMKTKVRETIRIVDKDHHIFEWYENRGSQDVKTMEINYTRKK
jgi:Protein of unknown function (DUF1579)